MRPLRFLAPLLLLASLLAPATARSRPEPDLAPFFAGHDGAFVMLDVRNDGYVRYNPERCRKRFTPCSTFKIPNTLIALETGAIPSVDYRLPWDGTRHPIAPWNRDHTVRTAFPNSVVWYYQEVARRVGPDRMRKHVRAIGYGNQDLSGPVDGFWLDSSLKISAEEQVAFLRRLHARELPFSRKVMDDTVEVMKLAETGKGVLRAKTGTAGDAKTGVATLGWFVGWVESGGNTYVFATNLSGGENPSGRTARAITEEILKSRGLL